MTAPNPPEDARPPTSAEPAQQPRFGSWMGSMWLYTVLRFGLFFALWGVLYLIGLKALPSAAIALVLSIPLSYALLARPRARMTAQIEARMAAHRQARADLDHRLDPGNDG